MRSVRAWLASDEGLHAPALTPFEVASGLDSAVLGETEILGQIRAAWKLAQREGAPDAVRAGATEQHDHGPGERVGDHQVKQRREAE